MQPHIQSCPKTWTLLYLLL